jgi:DNA-binding NarL/FixJ family response regulator
LKELGKSKEEGQKTKLKVFIMDDSEIFRTGLAHILEQEKEDFELSGCEEYSDEVERLCTAAAPDVIIVHSSMREMDKHLEIAGRIKEKREDTRILAITEFNDVEYLLKIAVSGCDGYVHSKISRHSLVKVIKNLGRDIYIFDRTAINKILSLENERRIANKVQFSPRERKIVEMLAEGKNNTAIGKELELSSGTVKNIISKMLNRYHFKKRAQLVNELSAE